MTKRPPLRTEVNNEIGEVPAAWGAEAASIDFVHLRERGRYWAAMVRMVLLLPFQCIAAVFRFCWKTGIWIVSFFMKLIFGIIGGAVILMVAYGLMRTLFYPLFH